MKGNILKPDFKIIDRNDPQQIINEYFKILEQNLMLYDLEDHRAMQALVNLQAALMWWNFYCED